MNLVGKMEMGKKLVKTLLNLMGKMKLEKKTRQNTKINNSYFAVPLIDHFLEPLFGQVSTTLGLNGSHHKLYLFLPQLFQVSHNTCAKKELGVTQPVSIFLQVDGVKTNGCRSLGIGRSHHGG